jgi:hypothetical protein
MFGFTFVYVKLAVSFAVALPTELVAVAVTSLTCVCPGSLAPSVPEKVQEYVPFGAMLP